MSLTTALQPKPTTMATAAVAKKNPCSFLTWKQSARLRVFLAPLNPDRLCEPVVAGGDVVDHDAPLPARVDGPQRARVLHLRRAEEGPLLLQRGQAVHRQVRAQQDILLAGAKRRDGLSDACAFLEFMRAK